MNMVSSRLKVVLLFAALLAGPPAQAGFSAATKHGSASGCAAGSFFDPRNGGECWACPAGYNRTLHPVTDAKACSKAVKETFASARYHNKAGCASGSFFDPRNGGECWACPGGYNRTAYAVTDSRACSKPGYEELKRADKVRKNTHVGQGCPGGAFWDVKGGDGLLGACYTCGGGWNRTAHAVDSGSACSRRVPEQLVSAAYKGKFLCSSGQFLDPRNQGECWSCPADHPRRTAYGVTDGKACASKDIVSETLANATYKNKFACPAGQFFDPRSGGECWSCPSNHQFRTINAVTGKMACTDKALEIFAADTREFCKALINGLAAGKKGMEDVGRQMDVLIEPVKKPLEHEMAKLTSKLRTPAEVDKLFGDLTRMLDSKALDEVMRLQGAVKAAGRNLDNVLLDSRLVCEGTPAQIDHRLAALGLRPNLKTGSTGDWFIGSAQAATKQVFLTVSVSGGITSPQGLGYSAGYTLVTNFAGTGGFYATMGPAASTSKGASLGFGVMVFPHNEIGDFGLAAIPGAQISIGAGDKIKTFFEKAGKISKVFPDSLDVAFDPTFQTWPGIGLTKGVGGEGSKVIDITGSVSWSFPIATWGR